VNRVAGAIEDWQDMCPGRGDAYVVRYSRQLVVEPQTTHRYGRWVFDRVWPQNSVVVVLVGISGNTFHHNKWCIKARQHVERMAVGSKA
jgi:hypothetical protein